jgi:hypothetical protein
LIWVIQNHSNWTEIGPCDIYCDDENTGEDRTNVARLLIIQLFLLALSQPMLLSDAFAQDSESPPENAMCLGCHNMQGFAMPDANGEIRALHVSADQFSESVHAG